MPASIFNGEFVKLLKDKLKFKTSTANVEALSDSLQINDLDGSHVLRKEVNLRFVDDFKAVTPVGFYTESAGLTNAVVADTSADNLDGFRSASFTITTGDDTETIKSPAHTGLKKVDYGLLGISLDWLYDGNFGDVDLVVEESSDDITYTENARLQLPTGQQDTPPRLMFKLLSTSTHYKYYLEIKVDNNAKIMEWKNVKVFTDPLNYKEVIDTQSLIYSAAGSSFQDHTNEIRFPAAFTDALMDHTRLFSIVDDAANTRTKIRANADIVLNVSASTNVSSLERQVTLNVLGTTYYKGGSAAHVGGGATHVSDEIEMSAGQELVIFHTVNNGSAFSGTLVNSALVNRFSFSATEVQSQVVVKTQSSETDSEIHYNTATTHGSTDTKVRLFSTLISSSGDAITEVSNAANGSVFTVQERGIYSITYTEVKTGASDFAITKNCTQLTTNPSAITDPLEILASGFCSTNNRRETISWEGLLEKNDVIRAMTDGVGSGALSNRINFTIAKQAINPMITFPVNNELMNYVRAEGNGGTAITANVTNFDFIEITDSASAFDGTTYTVQKNGSTIDINFRVVFTTATERFVELYKNGVFYKRLTNDNTTHFGENGSYLSINGEFVEGDLLTLRSGGNGGTLNNVTTTHFLSIVERYEATGGFLGNVAPTKHVTGGTEYKIPLETWDGKQVYARSFTWTGSNSGVFTIATTATNLDIIDMSHTIKFDTNLWSASYPFGTGYNIPLYNESTGVVSVSGNGVATVNEVRITLKYVK